MLEIHVRPTQIYDFNVAQGVAKRRPYQRPVADAQPASAAFHPTPGGFHQLPNFVEREILARSILYIFEPTATPLGTDRADRRWLAIGGYSRWCRLWTFSGSELDKLAHRNPRKPHIFRISSASLGVVP